MRWLAALGVILLAFGVFVFVEARGTTSADADSEVIPRAPQRTTATDTPTSGANEPTMPTTQPKQTLGAIVENIRAKHGSTSGGAAPALEPGAGEAGSGSAERPADADDYLPYPDGSPPSATRVKMRGALRRFKNANYKGAFEAADSLIQAWPTDPEAFTIAVPSLCALGDTDKASTYFGRVTDEDARKQILEGCEGFGVKLP